MTEKELLQLLASYQVGYKDALEEVIRVAMEKLEEKIKEIKDANAKEG